MDEPDLDPALLRVALRDLDRLNALSGTAARLTGAIRRMVTGTRSRRGDRLVVLDCGCGGGGMTRALAGRLARDAGLRAAGIERVRLVGLDATGPSIVAARRAARGWRPRGAGRGPRVDLAFREGRIPDDTWPETPDIVVSSLFLHHLDDATIDRFLAQCATEARIGVAMEDLRRGRLARAGVTAVTRVVSRCPVVHVDGPRSVDAALTPNELSGRASAAGLNGAAVRPVRPFRFRLEWCRRCGP